MTILLRQALLLLVLNQAWAVTPSRHRVLRGQKRDKQARTAKKDAQGPSAKKVPVGEPKKGTDKEPGKAANRQYQNGYDYNYFVEACQEELVADVINGGIISHSQYVNFVYGYCHNSELHGPECTKEKESQGFDGLSNDMKLMYIKSFCPEDVDGQVSCLHGINDRGRDYEFADEITNLCMDLEQLMIKNFLLEAPEKEPNDFNSYTDINSSTSDKPQQAAPTSLEGGITGPPPGYTEVGAFQTGFDIPGQTPARTPIPTQRPTARPTSRATPNPTAKQHHTNAGQAQMQPPPWEREESANGNTGLLEEDSRGTVAPAPTNYPRPDLVVLDAHGNPIVVSENDNDDNGLSGGSKAAIVLIVLLGIVIAFTSFLLIQKKRRQIARRENSGIPRNFFFMKMRKVADHSTLEDTATYDKTYIDEEEEEEESEEGSEEQNESLGSNGEIEFNGPLFESWPNVSRRRIVVDQEGDEDLLLQSHPHNDLHTSYTQTTVNESTALRSGDDVVLDASEMEEHTDTEDEPSTFASSILSSFFSRTNWRGAPEDNDAPSTHNAIDEIKRAIDNAQWQEVYYLASKMAAEGNIDSNENLQSALVRTDEGKGQSPSRDNLKPEEAARAAQLDVSMAAGDWITLAARAAVFAALESANNPVPASITVVNKETVDECLAKAKAALEEAEKEQAKRQAQKPAASTSSDKKEKIVYVNADDPVSDRDFDYPQEDYSDFSKTSTSEGSCSASRSSSKKSPDPPRQPAQTSRPQSQSTMVEEVDSSDDEDDSDCDSSKAASHLPGPPSIAMSNQSTIPTERSDAPSVQFSNMDETYRGPLRRDFENGVSYPLEQEEETERPPHARF